MTLTDYDSLFKEVTAALLPDTPSTVRRRFGVCGALAAGPPPTATVNIGGTSIAGIRFLDSASATSGDVVVVDFSGPDPLILGRLRAAALGGAGQLFNTGLELYQNAGTPYVDFHHAADPAGDSGADYNMRLINSATGYLECQGGVFKCNGGFDTNSTLINGTAGRNFFKDSELSSGNGLRVGAAWGIYGIYSESGQVVVGSTDGRIYLNGQAYGPSIANNTFAECVAGANLTAPGGGLPGTRNYIIQAFTQVQNFTTGNANITFPAAFPRGVLTVVMSNGDSAGSAGGAFALLSTSNYSLTGCGVSCANASNNTYITGAVRMNIVAIGW